MSETTQSIRESSMDSLTKLFSNLETLNWLAIDNGRKSSEVAKAKDFVSKLRKSTEVILEDRKKLETEFKELKKEFKMMSEEQEKLRILQADLDTENRALKITISAEKRGFEKQIDFLRKKMDTIMKENGFTIIEVNGENDSPIKDMQLDLDQIHLKEKDDIIADLQSRLDTEIKNSSELLEKYQNLQNRSEEQKKTYQGQLKQSRNKTETINDIYLNLVDQERENKKKFAETEKKLLEVTSTYEQDMKKMSLNVEKMTQVEETLKEKLMVTEQKLLELAGISENNRKGSTKIIKENNLLLEEEKVKNSKLQQKINQLEEEKSLLSQDLVKYEALSQKLSTDKKTVEKKLDTLKKKFKNLQDDDICIVSVSEE